MTKTTTEADRNPDKTGKCRGTPRKRRQNHQAEVEMQFTITNNQGIGPMGTQGSHLKGEGDIRACGMKEKKKGQNSHIHK